MRKYLLKTIIILIPIILAGAFLQAASLEEMLSQAKAKYNEGSFKESMDIFELATSAYQKDVEAKKAIAEAYTEIGVREYDNRNFKNAYECFRAALKLAPTNQVASQYFWKMKKEFDVNNLKNEGIQQAVTPPPGVTKEPVPTVAAVEKPPAKLEEKAAPQVAPASVTPQPPAESPEMKEALEKLKKAEQELEALKNTTTLTKSESEKLRAELEAQKRKAEEEIETIKEAASKAKAESAMLREELFAQRKMSEQELQSLKEATTSAKGESAMLRAELEAQRKRSELELQSIKEATSTAKSESAMLRAELEAQRKKAEEERSKIMESALTARTENVRLKGELDQQKQIIEQLKENMRRLGQTTQQENIGITEAVAFYKDLLEKDRETRDREAKLLEEQLDHQREFLEKQTKFNTNLIMIIGGVVFLTFAFLITMSVLTRARVRRQFERLRQSPYYYGGPLLASAEGAPHIPLPATPAETFLLDLYPSPPKGEEGEKEIGEEEAMYRDLLRAGRLKKMYDQMKSGTLKWETVKDYIQELDKELRVEILKVVEAKILENDLFSPQAVLPILFPFLTEHDDYLREKAEDLAKKALLPSTEREIPGKGKTYRAALLEAPEEATKEPEDSPLSLKRCLEIAEKLKTLLKGRDASPITAKLARGIGHILGLSNEDEDLLYRATLVHDAGYLMLDKSKLQRIIMKTTITEEDFKFIRSHTNKGPQYFKGIKLPVSIKDAILYHHERNDGSGYPRGLTSPEIPLFAKIIGVSETYVALLSKRPYREKLSPEGALAILKDGINVKFDRDHVKALEEFARRTGGIK
ncbi:MAG: HD domain-containing phosphohydrolase [Spirochaetota bacterium]